MAVEFSVGKDDFSSQLPDLPSSLQRDEITHEAVLPSLLFKTREHACVLFACL